MEFRIIDTVFSPYGEKATFLDLLKKISTDIKSKKYDLIFVHSLASHTPYGFNKKCNYEGQYGLGNYRGIMSKETHVYRHNIDRLCILNFLDDFLVKLKKEKYFDNLEIMILSDHGARIKMDDPDSALKNILFYKKPIQNYKEINKKHILQETFVTLMIK